MHFCNLSYENHAGHMNSVVDIRSLGGTVIEMGTDNRRWSQYEGVELQHFHETTDEYDNYKALMFLRYSDTLKVCKVAAMQGHPGCKE